jgi:hypothetical protein
LETQIRVGRRYCIDGVFLKGESELCCFEYPDSRRQIPEALMTELEVLERRISEFKRLLDEGWRSLSRSALTTFERRELRNDMKRCGAELQRCLELVDAERSRARTRLDQISGRKVIDFRLIGRQEAMRLETIAATENAL